MHSTAVDFGVDNAMAVVSDTGKSILFKGRFVKSVNQYFMKEKAERVWSKYLDQLSAYRTNYIRDCFHKMSTKLLEWCQRNDIGYLVLGSNNFWKQRKIDEKTDYIKQLKIGLSNMVSRYGYENMNEFLLTLKESKAAYEIYQQAVDNWDKSSDQLEIVFDGLKQFMKNWLS